MYFPSSRTLNHHCGVTPGHVPVLSGGNLSPLSLAYMKKAKAICLLLFKQATALAFCFALDKAGKSIAARIAMMAITTNSSMRVNPPVDRWEERMATAGRRVRD